VTAHTKLTATVPEIMRDPRLTSWQRTERANWAAWVDDLRHSEDDRDAELVKRMEAYDAADGGL
jgi:hypothetical protein